MIGILRMMHEMIDWALSLYQTLCQALDLEKQTDPHSSLA